jgi:glycosyltransferase involved in cell wall biosynthesis
MPHEPMRLSVVMASMNEEKSIRAMIEEIRKNAPLETEILIVDSSKDRTPEIARELGAVVIAQEPQGHGMALKKALHEASGDVVLTTDCDVTYPMDQIPKFLSLVENEKYDLVSGCRLTNTLKKEMPFSNKIANTLFAWMVRILYGIKTNDVSTGMFAMTNEYAKTDWKGNFSLPAEIIIRSKLSKKRYLEIPIDYKIRVGETTLNKWRSGKAYMRCFFHWKFGLFKNKEL